MMGAFSSRLDKIHYIEWENSGVSHRIIELNVSSLHDPQQVDQILNRNTRRRWKHSSSLVPCWMVAGSDPLTGEMTLEGVQIKPDNPPTDSKGKVQKYIGASGVNASPLFLDTGIEHYWQTILKDKSIPIIITEGAKKAGCGLSIGAPTISIPGVSTCRKRGRLHRWIEAFAGFGRTFYLCFDADVVEKRPVQNSLLLLAKDLSATGSKTMVVELPSLELKGMDDFIVAKGKDEFQLLINEAKTAEEWKKELDEKRNEEQSPDIDEVSSKVAKRYFTIREHWGESLRMNILKSQIELDGNVLNADHLRLDIALEFGFDVSAGDAQAIVEKIANANSYNPVVEYLDEVAVKNKDIDTSILDNLATEYFAADQEIHNIYMKKMLISAIARARQPGCKVDTCIILVGGQGKNKSTFWERLFGRDWFTDELSDANPKDELLKLHQFWGLEIPEIEHMYKRKDIGVMKKFMSSTCDVFRSPYARDTKPHKRRCVLVGTSNERELLNDPTGNRRFWIVPVSQEIPLDKVVAERDRIWAAANALYESGYQWWLTNPESSIHEEQSKDYHTVDPWEEKVISYIKTVDEPTTQEILQTALGVEPGRQDMALAKRVAAILRRGGYEQNRKRRSGSPLRVWVSTDIDEKNKVVKVAGSAGSGGSGENFSSEEQKQSENENSDSIYLDHPQPTTEQGFQTTNKITDPGDPLNFQTFKKNNNTKSTEKQTTSVQKKAGRDWRPLVGEKVLYVNEVVTVVGFKDGGKEYQIEFNTGRLDFVKRSALSPEVNPPTG